MMMHYDVMTYYKMLQLIQFSQCCILLLYELNKEISCMMMHYDVISCMMMHYDVMTYYKMLQLIQFSQCCILLLYELNKEILDINTTR